MVTELPQAEARRAPRLPEVIVVSHSGLLYWWPAWAVGYVMALLTWLRPTAAAIDGQRTLFFPGNDVGVIYALLLLVLLLVTNTQLRGYSSTAVALAVAFVALLFAYLKWWDRILAWFGNQSVHLNLGFFLFFSTGLLLLWLVVVFGLDRLSFWRIRPGQVTHEYLLGVTDQSFDMEAVIFSKRQADLFRHWILGLGSGDLRIQTVGGLGTHVTIPNVLFVGAKASRIQRLVAAREEVE